MSNPLAQRLLECYLYEKEQLLEKAGVKNRLNRERLTDLMQPRMEAMAETVTGWDVSPDVVMAAAFAWAKRNKHPDGPMPTVLPSVKYLSKALSYYLEVPYEVVMEKRCYTAFLDRLDFEFLRFKKELDQAGVTELSSATSYPVEFRYLMAVQSMQPDEVFYMAQETLERMAADRRVKMWMEHRGLQYNAIAEKFNKRRKS